MIEELKPYPAYKDSGIPWLGEVPEHWRVERAKWLFDRVERPVRDTDDVVTCFRDGVVTLRKNRRTTGFTESLKEIGYQGIRRGDLVIHAMDAFAGAVGVSDSDGKGTPVYAVCKAKVGIDPHYYASVVREMARSQWVLALSRGIRERSTDFRFEAFASESVPVPPSIEQETISRFLRHVDGRISRAIRSKQKLIKLLDEQRQAVLYEVVTVGMNPDAPMQEAGVPFLQTIPAHWTMVPVRALMTLKKTVVGAKSDDYTLLSLTKRGVIPRDMENPEGKFPSSFETYQVVEPGDFIFCLFDIDETPRALGRSTTHGMITGAYTRFSCRDPDVADFLYLFYLAMDNGKHLKPLYTGLRKVITKTTFLSAKIPVPPEQERKQIVEHVRRTERRIDAARDRARREIALLTEYRSRLMADVVTGRLDVREVAPQLPEQFHEPDELDETGLPVGALLPEASPDEALA